MINSILLITSLFTFSETSAAQSACYQLEDAKVQLQQCLSNKSQKERDLSAARAENEELTRLLNSNNLEQELRNCQDVQRDLMRENRDLWQQSQNAQDDLTRKRWMLEEADRKLQRSTDGWRCVVMERKFANARIGEAKRREDALFRAKNSDIKDLIRKHGSFDYCFRIPKGEIDAPDRDEDDRGDDGRGDDRRGDDGRGGDRGGDGRH